MSAIRFLMKSLWTDSHWIAMGNISLHFGIVERTVRKSSGTATQMKAEWEASFAEEKICAI